jgi:hypothetical protein
LGQKKGQEIQITGGLGACGDSNKGNSNVINPCGPEVPRQII